VRRESRWAALLSDGGELRFLNGWAIGGRFDGEFANRAQTYGHLDLSDFKSAAERLSCKLGFS
jgi:hypothetical protein